MIRYSGLKVRVDHTQEDIRKALLKKLRTKNVVLVHFSIVKKSLDARDKNYIHWNYILDFTTTNDTAILKNNKGRKEFSSVSASGYRLPLQGRLLYDPAEHGRICIVGAGPAGLFAAYFLAENGYRPVLIERGEPVEDRLKTVEQFWKSGNGPDPNSNIQFGEGGAGTFSDGKLNTGVNDPSGRNHLVLSTFVKNGAPEHILYDSKPHIGSDILIEVIRNMRSYILQKGGEILFRSQMVELDYIRNHSVSASSDDLPAGFLTAVKIKDLSTGLIRTLPCKNLVLAPGHSARDTFSYLIRETPLQIKAKPFAVGVRVQHPQEMINTAQYGEQYKELYGEALPPADYKLVRHTEDGENVYSFCMCPGGYVVNSSSETGRLCINGMSYSGRAGENANAAIVTGVRPSDDPEENIRYQQELEEKAFRAADGAIPVQRFADFESGNVTNGFGRIQPSFKGAYAFADLNPVLGEKLSGLIKESLHVFAQKIKGFDDPDTLISAVESRTSSPVRILRDEHLEANIKGLFPCGEGAGYAGGITSAAIDGIKVFEEIYRRYLVIQGTDEINY